MVTYLFVNMDLRRLAYEAHYGMGLMEGWKDCTCGTDGEGQGRQGKERKGKLDG